jgi:hypothetical protein
VIRTYKIYRVYKTNRNQLVDHQRNLEAQIGAVPGTMRPTTASGLSPQVSTAHATGTSLSENALNGVLEQLLEERGLA